VIQVTRDIIVKSGAPVAAFVLVVLIWAAVVRLLALPVYLLPSPAAVARVFIQGWPSLRTDFAVTVAEAGLGFLIGNAAGFLVTIVFAYSPLAERAFYPYAIALKTTQIVAMAPILILWFGSGIGSKIIASSVICFFPIYDRYRYDNEKRAALDKWAEVLSGIVDVKPAPTKAPARRPQRQNVYEFKARAPRRTGERALEEVGCAPTHSA
jgi:hypothetical protein